jgi:hypothetical protein
MPWRDIVWHVNHIREQRQLEAAAIRKAQKR